MTKCAVLGAVLLAIGALVAAPIPKTKELPATEKQRELAQDNLKRIGLAFHNYDSAFGHLPHDLADKKGKPTLSWRVAILPYLDDGDGGKLYEKFALDEPWDSKTNRALIAEVPKHYKPVRANADAGHTFLRGFAGNGAFFEPGKKRRITEITDGTSNTIGIVEAGESVVWTMPGSDIPFDLEKPLPPLGKDIDGIFHAARLDPPHQARVRREEPEAGDHRRRRRSVRVRQDFTPGERAGHREEVRGLVFRSRTRERRSSSGAK